MQNFLEAAREVAIASSVVVQVLLSADDSHLEFLPITRTGENTHLPSVEEFAARRLRTVAVLGLRGSETICSAFAEDVSEPVIAAIGTAFTAYVSTLLGPDFADQIARAEVEALERLHALSDNRVN